MRSCRLFTLLVTGVGRRRLRVNVLVRCVLCAHREGVLVGMWVLSWSGYTVFRDCRGLLVGSGGSWLVWSCLSICHVVCYMEKQKNRGQASPRTTTTMAQTKPPTTQPFSHPTANEKNHLTHHTAAGTYEHTTHNAQRTSHAVRRSWRYQPSPAGAHSLQHICCDTTLKL